jgi:hypothetical protein
MLLTSIGDTETQEIKFSEVMDFVGKSLVRKLTLAERIEIEESELRESKLDLLEETLCRFDENKIAVNVSGSAIEWMFCIDELNWSYNRNRTQISLSDLNSGSLISLNLAEIIDVRLSDFDNNCLRIEFENMVISLDID